MQFHVIKSANGLTRPYTMPEVEAFLSVIPDVSEYEVLTVTIPDEQLLSGLPTATVSVDAKCVERAINV